MSWAYLNSKFFQDHPPRRESFDRHAQDFTWGPEVLPVYEWKHLVYIAAVHPHEIHSQKNQWPDNWVLLQCEPAPLESLWQSWSLAHDLGLPAPAKGPDFPPPPPDFETVSLSREITQPRFDLKSLENPTPEAIEEKTNPPIDLLDLKPQAPPSLAAANTSTPTTPSNDLDFKPDELFASFSETSANSTDPVQSSDELILQDSVEDAEAGEHEPIDEAIPLEIPEGLSIDLPVPLAFETPTAASIIEAPSSEQMPGIKPEEKTAAKVTEKTAEKITVQTEPTPEAQAEVLPKKTAARTALHETTTDSVAFSEASASELPSELSTRLEDLPPSYHRSLIAIRDRNLLRILSFSRDLKETDSSSSPSSGAGLAAKDFPLDIPSPFRIALRTEKPYHGPVSPSPLMETFAQYWNKSILPECMTVIPFYEDESVVGFLILLGDAQANSKANLSAAEKMAVDLFKIWPRKQILEKAKAS